MKSLGSIGKMKDFDNKITAKLKHKRSNTVKKTQSSVDVL